MWRRWRELQNRMTPSFEICLPWKFKPWFLAGMGTVNPIWGDPCRMGPRSMVEDLYNSTEAKKGQEKNWCCWGDDLAAWVADGVNLFWKSATTELPRTGDSDEHLLLSNALLLLLGSSFLLAQHSWCPWASQKNPTPNPQRPSYSNTWILTCVPQNLVI